MDSKNVLQLPSLTSNVDIATAAVLAKVLSTAVTAPRTERAEYETLGRLYRTFVEIENAESIPLNFHCRTTPPRIAVAVELRGYRDGLRIEPSVDEFLALLKGDFRARQLTRYALAKIAQCLSKYGLMRDEPYILREFANLDEIEDEQAAWIGALSHLQANDWQQLAQQRGARIDVCELSARSAIPAPLAEVIITMIQRSEDRLIAPQLPDGWHNVQFVCAPAMSPRRRI